MSKLASEKLFAAELRARLLATANNNLADIPEEEEESGVDIRGGRPAEQGIVIAEESCDDKDQDDVGTSFTQQQQNRDKT